MALDLNAIKTAVKSILDTANDSGAAYDLSTGMAKRVQTVAKMNSQLIPMQSTLFPYVSVSITDKEHNPDSFAKNQATAKRRATLTLEIVGAVWMSQITDKTEDPGDEEIEKLMENIEQLIRNNDTLNDTVKWTKPGSTTYHAARIDDEQSHLRVGIFSLECEVFY
jgi:hypothetical protein